jgi:hypothetical protein
MATSFLDIVAAGVIASVSSRGVRNGAVVGKYSFSVVLWLRLLFFSALKGRPLFEEQTSDRPRRIAAAMALSDDEFNAIVCSLRPDSWACVLPGDERKLSSHDISTALEIWGISFPSYQKIRSPIFVEARQKQDSPRSPKKQSLGKYVVSKGCVGQGAVENSEIIWERGSLAEMWKCGLGNITSSIYHALFQPSL